MCFSLLSLPRQAHAHPDEPRGGGVAAGRARKGGGDPGTRYFWRLGMRAVRGFFSLLLWAMAGWFLLKSGWLLLKSGWFLLKSDTNDKQLEEVLWYPFLETRVAAGLFAGAFFIVTSLG